MMMFPAPIPGTYVPSGPYPARAILIHGVVAETSSDYLLHLLCEDVEDRRFFVANDSEVRTNRVPEVVTK